MALGEEPGPPPFAWHDTNALVGLLEPFGFTVVTEESALSFRARSSSEYIDQEFRHHPMWVEARSILEPAGTWDQTAALAARILEDGNEDRDAFCITSRFVIASAFRGGRDILWHSRSEHRVSYRRQCVTLRHDWATPLHSAPLWADRVSASTPHTGVRSGLTAA